MTFDAPAASASATSRGWRTPPSAHTCAPSSRAAAAHSSTAENCGRPTPVIIRVVHIAPGPTPTLTMSAPASTRSRDALGGDDVARDDRHLRVERADRPQRRRSSAPGGRARCRRPARRRPASSSAFGLGRDVAVDADRGGDPQPAVGVERPGVERGAQRAAAGEDADQPAVGVDHRGERGARPSCEPVERRPRGVDAGRQRRAGRGDMTSRSWVKRSTPAQSASVTTPTGRPSSTTTTAPCARLGSRASASATVSVGSQRDRRVVDEVARLDPGDDLGDDVDRDVLRDDGEAAAAGDRLGHPPAGDGGHVRDDERDGRAGAVGRGEVDVEPGGDGRARRAPGRRRRR